MVDRIKLIATLALCVNFVLANSRNTDIISRKFLRPQITPDLSEMILDVGDRLQLICEANGPVTWTYPNATDFETNDSPGNVTVDTAPSVDHKKATHLAKLVIENVTYLNVGYYYCHYYTADLSFTQSEQVSSIYIYVRDPNHLLLPVPYVISGKQGSPLIVPCRPTSPEVTVTLLKDGEENIDSKIFVKRVGFYLNDVNNSGLFLCEARGYFDRIESATVFLNIMISTQSLSKPVITDLSEGHVVGEDLLLTCSIEYEEGVPIEMTWLTPNYDARRVQISPVKTYHNHHAQRNLTINQMTLNDSGNYTCKVQDHQRMENMDTITVEVSARGTSYIVLSEANNASVINTVVGADYAQWVVNINAYPSPKLEWFDNRGRKVQLNVHATNGFQPKYIVNSTKTMTKLRIGDVTSDDAGVYVLRATNRDVMQTLNMTLNVLAKPSVEILAQEYHLKGHIATLECHVAGNPPPDIYWSFKPCLDDTCAFLSINETKFERKQSESLHLVSILKFYANDTGLIRCEASNSVGDSFDIKNFIISDVQDGFSIWHDHVDRPIAVGDTLTFTCAISKYNFTGELKWYQEKRDVQILMTPGDGVELKSHSTNYTQRLDLIMYDIQKEDAGVYKCTSDSHNSQVKMESLKITVSDPEKPVILSTNLNGTKIVKKLGEPFELTCMASGIPVPEITWIKDDKVWDKKSKRIKIGHGNQKVYFTYSQMEDEGTYMCRVANRVGFDTRHAKLVIEGKVGLQAIHFVFLAVIITIFIILLLIIWWKNRKARRLKKTLRMVGLNNFFEGAIDSLNPDLPLDDQAELLPYDKRFEFPREKLKLGKQLGSGEFGVVMKAEALGIVEDGVETTVAVKMVRRNTDFTYIKALVSELKIMIHLGKHLNVVNLLGACTKDVNKREICVIVEYCRYGNLHQYLLRHREKFINQIDLSTGQIDHTIGAELLARDRCRESFNPSSAPSSKPFPPDYRAALKAGEPIAQNDPCCSQNDDAPTVPNDEFVAQWRSNYHGDYRAGARPICTQDLLCWAFQVARGMEYLASRKVLHGDLAARNILLADDNIVKICDFGLAKNIYKSNNYTVKGDCRLPIKWMALESIRDHIFSTQSDVWSFGIVLWEFFSLAKTPYPGMSADENFLGRLITGYRMEQPEYSTLPIYQTMIDCWDCNPKRRPSFTKLAERLGFMLEDSVREHYIELNSLYVTMNHELPDNDMIDRVGPPDYGNLVSSISSEYINELNPRISEESGYLSMARPGSDGSSRRNGINANDCLDSGVFDLELNKKYKSKVEDCVDAIELTPMMGSQVNESSVTVPLNSPHIENPSYFPNSLFKDFTDKDDKKLNNDDHEGPELVIDSKTNPFSDQFVGDGLLETVVGELSERPRYQNFTSRDWERA